MFVRKVSAIKAVCPHCGAEISMSFDEYMKYREEVEDYCGSVITCQREDEDGKSRDIEYTNLDCPVCEGYIPLTVADGIDADKWGFVHSNNSSLVYESYKEVKLEDYIKRFFGASDDEEGDDEV